MSYLSKFGDIHVHIYVYIHSVYLCERARFDIYRKNMKKHLVCVCVCQCHSVSVSFSVQQTYLATSSA